MKKKIRKIVVAGTMGGLSIFLGATHIGFIPWFSGASLTIMHVPVVVSAVLEGPVVGIIVGFIFGAFSLLQASVAPTGPADVWFVNPVISILPRLFIGPVAWLVYRAVGVFFSGDRAEKAIRIAVGTSIAGIAGSLTNTVLVLGVLSLYKYIPLKLAATIAVINGLPEAGISLFLSLILVFMFLGIEVKFRGPKI